MSQMQTMPVLQLEQLMVYVESQESSFQLIYSIPQAAFKIYQYHRLLGLLTARQLHLMSYNADRRGLQNCLLRVGQWK